ncbi:SRPBCC family protein [Luteimonas sp. SX5]|uniref:SRPBCC family protein n=1 Tax=Luteimonas galliterrae TaxID=2940486 RepID=A0ABT0MGS2_9GAMM|nr:SRPBCC family protein [Luteimonas galliterrae]MCL1633863.1 SRPBCC family protein [Luteimonas galliterrae]
MNDHGIVTAPGTLRIERLMPGPIERLWAYLTEPEKRRAWLAGGDMQLRPGGEVELVFRNSELTDGDDRPPPKYEKYAGESRMRGRIVACEPPRLLSYTWGEGGDNVSEVSFELTPRADKVLLVVTHRNLATRDDMLSVAGGWHAHLGILDDRLNGREPAGFWRTHARLEAEYERRIAPA